MWSSHFTIGDTYEVFNWQYSNKTSFIKDHHGQPWHCDTACFEPIPNIKARCISKLERHIGNWGFAVSYGKEYTVISGPYSINGHSFIEIKSNAGSVTCDAECFKILEE